MATVLTSGRRNGNGSRLAVPAARPIRVAIYTRQSVSENGADSASLKVQREAAEAYVLSQRAENWVPLADRYDDAGVSGGTTERPALRRLLADVQAGHVDVVLTYKVDRLSRSLVDFVNMIALFDRHECRFVSVTQAFDSRGSLGRLSLGIMATFAEYERALIRERTRDAIVAARRKGKWTGGCAPWGYDIVSGKLIVNPIEAPRVAEAFKVYLEIGSLLGTAAALNERGWTTKVTGTRDGKTRGGKEWNKTNLHGVLTSPLYAGRIIAGGESVVGEHAAIIDEKTWQAVQEKLAGNAVAGSSGERRRSNALLGGGLLKCGTCGASMTPTHCRKGPRKYSFYACSRRVKGGKSACPAPYVSAPKVESEYVARIAEQAADPRVVEAVVAAATEQLAERKRTLAEESRAVHRAIRDIEKQRETLGGEPRARIDARIAENRGRLDALAVEREALNGVTIVADQIAGLLAGSFEQVWGQMTSRERRRVVELLYPIGNTRVPNVNVG